MKIVKVRKCDDPKEQYYSECRKVYSGIREALRQTSSVVEQMKKAAGLVGAVDDYAGPKEHREQMNKVVKAMDYLKEVSRFFDPANIEE